MRGFLFGLMVAAGALAGSAGCGKVSSSTGSNTNWLERCGSDADCGSGSQCWCNACTTTCASDGDCNGGICRTTDALGCGVPGVGAVCVAECAGDGDCLDFGFGLACRGAACLPATGSTMDGVGGGSGGSGASDAGAGDTGGTAGSSGSAPLEPRSRTSFGVAADDTCVVTGAELYCWGSNLYGQTGADPAEMKLDEPRLVVGLTDVAAIALNGQQTCALTTGGDVYCWGLNDAGQTGGPSAPENTCPDYVLDSPGDYPCQPTPTRVEGVSDAVEVAVGRAFSCARLASGLIQCWGDTPAEFTDVVGMESNASGLDLGTGGGCVWGAGGYSCSGVLEYLSGILFEIEDLQLGGSESPDQGFGCMLGQIGGVPGNVVCFGDNGFGERGLGHFTESDFAGTALGDMKAFTLGDTHACALGNDDKVRCWGRNTLGAVGPPWLASLPCGYDACEPSPVEIAGLPPIAAINAGGDRTCAFATDGTLWCWGADSQSLGAPLRVAGPWETNGEVCGRFVNLLGKTLLDGVSAVDHSCVTDADCVEVSLDISCHQTCAIAALPREVAEGASLLVSQNERNTCPQVSELGCQMPEVTCPEPTTQPICDAGYCTRADPAHSGCTDQCACSAERAARLISFQDECEGFDLWPAIGWQCPSCEQGAAYVVVMNRGSEPFSGEAMISWDFQEGGAAAEPFPDPMSVSLELAPGQISAAIRVESRGAGTAMLRITAEGDCNPLDDAGTQVSLPSATAGCD